ncbi:MAG: class I SAM-dependent methyltransferase [Thermomonas sp.]|uniref:class I SAM-dependent methyltransferase n=1 Tax=Thermomonas sp. TaxID=1971895 RepID=UPI001EC48DC2|nr:class I SAM-dependent methyltransferase [Thermomonas sp.]MBK6416215.1 class I SAM-dependent methyltransferase [Thermomonas sp.]MBK7205274.1 class I SAM-dependent methyltransferase [Thermomonas sp.]
MKCRFCDTPLHDVFLDLGSAPPSNAFLRGEDLNAPEIWFPLRLHTCTECHLVQVDEVQKHDALFSGDYVYFSSYSRSWLAHAEHYVAHASERLGLGHDCLVMEIASNDGYLLQYAKARGIPCVGIEPTASTAVAARERGIETIERFFGRAFAQEFATVRRTADLVVANNVLAHVPDLNDFVAGLTAILAPAGTINIEFPHLLQLVAQHQFDTVYHEHFSYFSFHTVQRILARHGLRVWDVEELGTHGGSLRLWVCHAEAARHETPAVADLLAKETAAGMLDMGYYRGFQHVADQVKDDFLAFLLSCKRDGKQVVGYGAAAKGNTLLNYAGVRPDLLGYVVDASPHKQGRYLPGCRIPVVVEARIRETRPDFVVILPWNLRAEITAQLAYIREWGGKFVTAVPDIWID